jgi:hypothetical protein
MLSPALGVVMDAFHLEGGVEALGDGVAASDDRVRVAGAVCGLAEGERTLVSWIGGRVARAAPSASSRRAEPASGNSTVLRRVGCPTRRGNFTHHAREDGAYVVQT